MNGMMEKASTDLGVVVTHPHPLYGGDMHNSVVESITRAFRQCAVTTLRFNFRGVGDSQGQHDKGIGEQADVGSAVDYLHHFGVRSVALAGYSFGAWVNALAVAQGLAVDRMLMVSPPVAVIDFADIPHLPCLALVVTGDLDEIAPVAGIKNRLKRWNPSARLEIIGEADHFYAGRLTRLQSVLAADIASQLCASDKVDPRAW